MKIGVSPTNIIYAGSTRKDKSSGMEIWTKREDVTEEAIRSVFEYMYNVAKETGKSQLAIEGFGKMTFEREDKN